MPSFLTDADVASVRQKHSAIEYDRAWDEALVNLLRQYRWQAEGYDPILAYWYAKELEVKTVRLVLSAKLGGLAAKTVATLVRPLYLPTV
jgi:V/A-type H+/Na+-transporting ATPase subunit C